MNLWMNNAVSAQLNSAWVSAYQPESEAIFAEMVSTPDIPRKLLIDALVVSLKVGGVWSKLDCLHVLVSHTEQAGLLNWIHPTDSPAYLAGPASWSVDDAFISDPVAGAIVTNFSPNSGVKFASHTNNEMGYYLSQAPTLPAGSSAKRVLMGVTDQAHVSGTLDDNLALGNEWWLATRKSNNRLLAYCGLDMGYYTGKNVAADLGLFSLSNSSYDNNSPTYGMQVWKQGEASNELDGILVGASYSKPTRQVALGAVQMGSFTPAIKFSSNAQFRLFYAGAKLTIAQRGVIAAALETFYAGV